MKCEVHKNGYKLHWTLIIITNIMKNKLIFGTCGQQCFCVLRRNSNFALSQTYLLHEDINRATPSRFDSYCNREEFTILFGRACASEPFKSWNIGSIYLASGHYPSPILTQILSIGRLKGGWKALVVVNHWKYRNHGASLTLVKEIIINNLTL